MMKDTLTLDQLQIKRRELENELTKLAQREQELKANLKIREKTVIEELEYIITEKKAMIQTLESQNSGLGKKLNSLKKTKKVHQQTQPKIEKIDDESEDEIEFAIVQETADKSEHQKTKVQNKKEKKFFF